MRLVGEDVEPGARDAARVQCRDQRVLVHHRTAGDVDEVAVGSERVEDRGVHQLRRSGTAGRQHDEHVAGAGELDRRGVVGPGHVLGAARVVVDLGAEGLEALGGRRPDPAQAEHPDDGSPDVAGQRQLLAAAPRATADEPVGGRDAAQHVDDQDDGQVGHRVGEDVGGVGHHDAAAGRLDQVDVVVADAEVGDRSQVRQRVHLGRADRGASTHDRHLDPRRVGEVGELGCGVALHEPLAHEGHQPPELDDTDRVLEVGDHRAILAGRGSRDHPEPDRPPRSTR